MILSGQSTGTTAGQGHGLRPARIHWSTLPGGGHYPFGLRARKAEVLDWMGRWDAAAASLEADLTAAGNALTRERAGCLFILGVVESHRGNSVRSEASLAEAVVLYETIGDNDGSFDCRARLVRLYLGTKRFKEGEELTKKLLAGARRSGDRKREVLMLNNRGMVCMHTGRPEEAIAHFDMVMKEYQRAGDLWAEAHTLGNIGNVHCDLGRYREAASFYAKSYELCRATGNTYSEYYALYNLAYACEMLGEREKSLTLYREDLLLAKKLGDGPGAEQVMEDIARIRGSMGDG